MVIWDISQRKLAEKALQELEKRYFNLLEVAPVGIAVHVKEKIVFTNPAGVRMFGAASEKDLIGHSINEIVHPDGLAVSRSRIIRMLKGEQGLYPAEDRYMKIDGTPVDVEIMAAPLEFNGEPAVQVIVTDITERKRIQENVKRQLQQLTTLRSIDRAIISNFDLRFTLKTIINDIANHLKVDALAILLLDRSMNELEVIKSKGFIEKRADRFRLKVGDCVSGRAVLQSRRIIIPDVAEAGDQLINTQLISGENFVSFISEPLISKGLVIGVLDLFHRSRLNPDPEWLDFLETLSEHLAIAIDNAELFKSLNRANMNLSVAYDSTIEGWSKIMDIRDKETEGHTIRVTEATLMLARRAGLSGEALTNIRRGALLHDMGKLGIPDAILLKPGKLTEEEWGIMKQHPIFVFDALHSIEYLQQAIEIPYCHHERWDGTGYPQGLKGNAIPLAARLFAVIDIWDALRSDRPYRQAWPEDAVLAHIRGLSGNQLDPTIVDLFLKMVEEGVLHT